MEKLVAVLRPHPGTSGMDMSPGWDEMSIAWDDGASEGGVSIAALSDVDMDMLDVAAVSHGIMSAQERGSAGTRAEGSGASAQERGSAGVRAEGAGASAQQRGSAGALSEGTGAGDRSVVDAPFGFADGAAFGTAFGSEFGRSSVVPPSPAGVVPATEERALPKVPPSAGVVPSVGTQTHVGNHLDDDRDNSDELDDDKPGVLETILEESSSESDSEGDNAMANNLGLAPDEVRQLENATENAALFDKLGEDDRLREIPEESISASAVTELRKKQNKAAKSCWEGVGEYDVEKDVHTSGNNRKILGAKNRLNQKIRKKDTVDQRPWETRVRQWAHLLLARKGSYVVLKTRVQDGRDTPWVVHELVDNPEEPVFVSLPLSDKVPTNPALDERTGALIPFVGHYRRARVVAVLSSEWARAQLNCAKVLQSVGFVKERDWKKLAAKTVGAMEWSGSCDPVCGFLFDIVVVGAME